MTRVIDRWWPSWLPRRGSRRDPDRLAGDAARDRHEWAAAAQAYERYLVRHPRHVAVWLRLGNMLKETARFDEAEAAYLKAARLDPTNAAPIRLRGEVRERQGDVDGAVAFHLQAWRTDRDPLAGRYLVRPDRLTVLARLQNHGSIDRITGAIDGLRGLALEGWAWDPTNSAVPVTIEISVGGRTLGRAVADRPRDDLASLHLAPIHSGFRFELGQHLEGLSEAPIEVRMTSNGEPLVGSPMPVGRVAGLARWLGRHPGPPGEAGPAQLSILTPVHDVRTDWFGELVDSVLAQTDGRWEWILIDDGSTDPVLHSRLVDLADSDPRIRLIRCAEPKGTAAAINLGLGTAQGAFVLFLDHDDRLEPEAVSRLIAAATPDIDLIYGDEAITGEDSADLRLIMGRPAFSWHFYLSHPYFVHPLCVRRSLAVKGWDESLAISADVDFVLRMLERARAVAHQPGVLYRWRTHDESMGHRAAPEVMAATQAILQRHLMRTGSRGLISAGPAFNSFRLDMPDDGGRTLVIIPTKDRADLVEQCLTSLQRTCRLEVLDIVVIDHESTEPALKTLLSAWADRITVMHYSGPFNYARMNNLAVRHYGGRHDVVLFLNNDIEALEPGWLEHMRGLVLQPDVGAVGATLLYPDGRVQHAGVFLGPFGLAEHAMKFEAFRVDGARVQGYNCGLMAVRDWSAVTGACLMMRTEVFAQVGGFDEQFVVGFNDTDLCLRVRQAGLKVLNDGWAVLTHHESATRATVGDLVHPEDTARFAARWAELIEAGDPFYNPMLSLRRDHVVEHPDTDRLAPRITQLGNDLGLMPDKTQWIESTLSQNERNATAQSDR